MTDLVVTCPKDFWEEWIAEGDPAGAPWSGEEWGWFCSSRAAPPIEVGDRLYIVAHGKLRGYAPVTALRGLSFDPKHGAFSPSGVYLDSTVLDRDPPAQRVTDWCICREGGAAAVTIAEPIRGFQGWRKRWWDRQQERLFPEWRIA